MKKLFLALAVLIGSLGMAHSETIDGVPQGPPQSLATADYGGVDISTVSVTTATQFITLTTTGAEIVVYGVVFSSGQPSDFVIFRDTAGLSQIGNENINQETLRLYNIGGSTQSVASGGGLAAGPNFPRYPARFKKGVLWNCSAATYNVVTVYFHRRRTP